DGPLLGCDTLLDRPYVYLAPADIGYCADRVVISNEYGLVFGNSLLAMALHAEHVCFCEMRQRAAWRVRDGARGQRLGAFYVSFLRAASEIQHPAHQIIGQKALCLNGAWIERQRAFK